MKFSWKVYGFIGLIALSSLLLARAFPSNQIAAVVLSIPGAGALLVALFQLLRDDAAYQKQVNLEQQRQSFEVGATSHMATVAFDRHVTFCEEYLKEVNDTIATLMREAETEAALGHAARLHHIRLKHAVWLTADIDRGLEPLEAALRKIGSGSKFYNSDPAAALKAGAVDEMFRMFEAVLEVKAAKTPEEEAVAVATIVRKLRAILGVEGLTSLRYRLLEADR